MKYFVRAASVILLSLFISCGSTQFHVPGEKTLVIENIFAEYYSIGDEYFALKNYTKAADFYLKASSSRELHNASLYKAGRCYALAKNWNKALEIYQEIEKYDSENIDVQQSLAYIYAVSGDFDRSEALYKSLVEQNPDISEVLVNYTIVLLSQERYEDAKTNLEIIKTKFPDDAKIKDISEKIKAWEEQQKKDDSSKVPEELREEKKAGTDRL